MAPRPQRSRCPRPPARGRRDRGRLRAALRAGLLLGALAVPGIAASAPTRVAPDELARAQQLYDGLQFEAAAQALGAALLRPGRSAEELAALYRLRGLIAAARDDNARAQGDFARWLELDPKGQLPPGVAPKIVAPFQAAQRARRAAPGLALRAMVSEGALRVQVVGDRARLGQALLLRWAGGGAEGELRADLPPPGPDGAAAVTLGPEGLGAGRLRYTLELLGEHGGRLARAGSLGDPLTLELAGAPLHRRWWLWTAVGGAAALGLGLGLGLGLRR